MRLSKCYQNVLIYECVKIMKRPVSMNTLMKVFIFNNYDEMRNHLMIYDVHMLEGNFHDVSVECNGTSY